VAFFDPLITTTAQEGYYVVFLINPLEQTISLSMNQGATSVFREFREKQGLRVLQRRAMDIKERLTDYAEHFSAAPISLSSLRRLSLGYEAGHAFGRTYEVDELNTDEFKIDLQKMLEAY
jgi:5-methylcytosine-specific restriction enzyme A